MYNAAPMPVPYQQYNNAYPTIHYQQPPGAANGYGWHGNGYGWQLDPAAWHTPPLYPTLNDTVVEEPAIQAEKVGKQNAYVRLALLLFNLFTFILMIEKYCMYVLELYYLWLNVSVGVQKQYE